MDARRSLEPFATLRRTLGIVAGLAREERALRRAARDMPRPVRWDWASDRVVPLLAGPYLGRPGEDLVRTALDPGCAVVFGVDLGGAFANVDVAVARRWECTTAQIRDAAMANLRQRASLLEPEDVASGTLSGRIVRLIHRTVGWASSLVLVPDELMRLFGSDDQILAAPGRSKLLSFPIDTPASVVADVVVDFERSETYPLWLDPFVLVDGTLHWQPADD